MPSLVRSKNMFQQIDMSQGIAAKPEPIRKCDACGKKVQQKDAINFVWSVGCTGMNIGFNGPGSGQSDGDYWACSTECWLKVAHASIDEHALPMLNYVRGKK